MPEPTEPVAAPPGGFVARLRGWAGGSPRRNLAVAVVLGTATVGTVVMWLTAAQVATAPEKATVEAALRALDDGEDELARSIVAELRSDEGLSAEEFGGALFVLGALKVRDAERQWSPERARSDYFIASKYLQEGSSIGFPEDRETEALVLLGKSLIESRQLAEGVGVLDRAIESGARGQSGVHLLLADAFFFAPRPDYRRTIAEVDIARQDPAINDEASAAAALLRAEALAALGRGDEALAAARGAGPAAEPARTALVEGKAQVARLEAAPPDARAPLRGDAEAALERARREDKLATSITRDAAYLNARVAELVGKSRKALEGYDQLWRRDGASAAGVAAALAEGDLHQRQGDVADALDAFRRALDAIEDPSAYRSGLMPLSEVQVRVRAAHERFLTDGTFDPALELADRVGRVLGETDRLALRAETLRRWGEADLAAAQRKGKRGDAQRRSGRERMRLAGRAYERLAEARYATPAFVDDLWVAAESLMKGQAYAETIRVLERYLRNEPTRRNGLALLRLGEAHLARGELDAAIASFDECLEFHPDDPASYAARLACAKAHRRDGDLAAAESLLRHNLTRTALTPASTEWRDTKFELGRLLFEAARYDAAIVEFEEAVKRYPDDPQSLLAQYQVATAHREAARAPLGRLAEAKTVTEKENARAEANERLEAALERFESVQNGLIRESSSDGLDRVTLRNCFMLSGDVLFELGRYEDAREAFANVSTLYQNEPYMLEAFVQIYHCWRRERDRPKALGVVQQARLLLERLPQDADFATSTNLSRTEWDSLLERLAAF